MGKIKIKLTSGIEDIKGVITAFKAVDDAYVVLDNESTGSMGLPIILVSKLVGNKIEKIADQTEWQKVKEYLKNIISGNKVEYFTVMEEISADDIFYTQLTLPIVSFEALKNNYRPVDEAPVAPVIEPVVPVAPVIEPVAPVAPVIEPVAPVVTEPTPIPSAMPVAEFATTSMPEMNMEPVVNDFNVTPASIPAVEMASTVSNQLPNAQELMTPPVLENQIEANISEKVDYTEMKETFMKACENMFDALVKKFEDKN